ncbi:hypothetical protein LNQ49_00930 [Flavobacterium sp. F-65]|uniref:Uncharacterized protein n=1 Tax=Flavobacterium pisciphilum TaxID=2893755 RepID=A0ABS8MN36_9FLAO|nr:hypothetical protein [Flavobacterium sp. F-65]MCC9070169.1 hypothetical protein [Flavobacterium sp. F-65]
MKHLFIIIVVLFFSCTKKKEIISDSNISKLSEGSYEIPSRYGTLNLFVLSDNDEIIVTNADYLNYVYVNHYKDEFKNYNIFLSNVLNEKKRVKKSFFNKIPYKSFKINKELEMEYGQLNFDAFFKSM